jgi:exodeoxyribonuclease V alpha subunit
MNARAVDPRHALLGQLQRLHALRPLDAEIGRFVLELDGEADPALGLAAAAASLAVAQGHSCLPLAQLADVLAEAAPAGAQLPEPPDAAAVRGALRGSRLVGDGSTEARTPLVLDAQERLYLRRYFRYESGVAAALRARLATTAAPAPDAAAAAAGWPPGHAFLLRHGRHGVSTVRVTACHLPCTA